MLDLCPEGVRVGVWCKQFYKLRKNVRPAYGWEPVFFRGGRRIRDEFIADWHRSTSNARQRVLGQKPDDFAVWVFRLLGMEPGDQLDDLYPGSGAIGRAWLKYQGQLALPYLRRFG